MTCYPAILFPSVVVKQAAPSLASGIVRISATADPGDVEAVVGILVLKLILVLFPFAIVASVSGSALRHCVRSFLRADVRAIHSITVFSAACYPLLFVCGANFASIVYPLEKKPSSTDRGLFCFFQLFRIHLLSARSQLLCKQAFLNRASRNCRNMLSCSTPA